MSEATIISGWEIEIWRRFKAGESASEIAQSLLNSSDGLKDRGDVGRGTVLKIVLLVESQMATSKFFRIEIDGEGCPDVIPIPDIRPPSNPIELEAWLRS